MANLGGRVRNARVARGITQLELARRASISRQALGAIESGLYQPGVMVALSLARELGETVETLFADNDEQQCTRMDVSWSDPEVATVGGFGLQSCTGSSCGEGSCGTAAGGAPVAFAGGWDSRPRRTKARGRLHLLVSSRNRFEPLDSRL